MFSGSFCGAFELGRRGVAGGFSGAFSGAFLRKKSGGYMGFSGAFSGAFLRKKSGGYIGPVSAQRELLRGAAVVYDGGGLLIGGARLIGPAGKIFAFASQASAEMWVGINRARAARELELMGGLDATAAAVYRQRKAAALAKISAAVLTAAARQSDAAKRAALVAESSWCASKWGAV